MKVLIVSTNNKKLPFPVVPIGACIIVSALRRHNIPVEFLDLCFKEYPLKELYNKLNQLKPDIVGFSIRNIDSSVMERPQFYLNEVKEMINICKKAGVIAVIGGAAVGILKEKALQYLEADYAIVGEGEEAFPKLIKSLQCDRLTNSIPGIIRYNNGLVDSSKWELIDSLSKLQLPAVELYDEQYFTYKRITPSGSTIRSTVGIQTKRGCPFKCIYCSYPKIEGHNIRFRKINTIIQEIKLITDKYGSVEIEFVDSVFNYPPEFAEAVCDEIFNSGLKVKWVATCNPAFITKKLLKKMISSGCIRIEFGIETACEKMITSLRKAFNVQDIRNAAKLCHEIGMQFVYYLLLGGPCEDRNTIRKTFEIVEETQPTSTLIMVGLRIYPGTELESIARSENKIFSDLVTPTFYISEGINEETWQDIRIYLKRNPNWILMK